MSLAGFNGHFPSSVHTDPWLSICQGPIYLYEGTGIEPRASHMVGNFLSPNHISICLDQNLAQLKQMIQIPDILLLILYTFLPQALGFTGKKISDETWNI